MPVDVSDVRSNPQDQMAHAARVLGRSVPRQKVFVAIHTGKKQAKTISEIVQFTGLPRKAVLNEARKLFNNHIIENTKKAGELAYVKDPFYTANKERILKLARDPEALRKFPTKVSSRTANVMDVTIRVPKATISVKQVTVDDIESFEHVVEQPFDQLLSPLDEKRFKEGLKRVIGEEGEFQDWGGETDDLFTTRLVLGGRRLPTAFGLKGKGTKGKLTPRKMGKNGDQIQRLFQAPADAFLVQYWSQIDESVIEQMRLFATAKSALEGRTIYYGVIDGQDTARMVKAYPGYFSSAIG